MADGPKHGEFVSRLVKLSPAQRALLGRQLANARQVTTRSALPAGKAIIPQAYPHQQAHPLQSPQWCPMTSVQRRVWAYEQLRPGTAAYNVFWTKRLCWPLSSATGNWTGLEVPLLEQAIATLVERHAPLRATFHAEVETPTAETTETAASSRQPSMRILPAWPEPIRVRCLAVEPDCPNPDARAQELATQECLAPFCLEQGPLLRVSLLHIRQGEQWLHLVMHHLVTDGWSMHILEQELAELYQSLAENRPPRLAPLPVSYCDYAIWLQQQAHQPDEATKAGLAHWQQVLQGAPSQSAPRPDFRPTGVADAAGWAANVPVPGELLQALEQHANAANVTLFSLLVTAWAVLLHRHSTTDQDGNETDGDVMVGTPLAGRSRPELGGLVGFFANTLPLRIPVRANASLLALAQQVQQQVLAAVEHQEVDFTLALEQSRHLPGLAGGVGFQTAVAFLESQPSPQLFPGLVTQHQLLALRPAHFPAMLLADHFQGQLQISVSLQQQLFRRQTAERLAQQFGQLLRSLVAQPSRPSGQLCIISEEERQQLLAWGQGPRVTAPAHTVPHSFLQQVRLRPHAVALVIDEGSNHHSTSEHHITYQQLWQHSQALAAALRHVAIQPPLKAGEVVAVVCHGGASMVAAFLGVMQAGAAYLPIAANDPPERQAQLLQAAHVRLAITAQASPPGWPAQVLCLPLLAQTTQAPTETASIDDAAFDLLTPDSPAYVMFTSGSTGRPKAVLVPHRGILRLVADGVFARLSPEEVVLHMAPPAFDASTFEIWAPLLQGGRCVLLGGQRFQPTAAGDSAASNHLPGQPSLAEIGTAIARHGVTTAWLTSSLFHAVIDEAPQILSPLRQLLFGGEAPSVPHVQKALQLLPGTALVNGYGPTECTTFASCYPVPRTWDGQCTTIPIGRPIGNTQLFVLDPQGDLAPIGVAGELHIAGDGVALGYLHQPEETAAVFLQRPFAPGLLYRTGDLVRWQPDGQLAFLGRLDDQVKIRGFRVEPAELEAALVALPGIAQAAVTVLPAPAGKQLVGKQLVAFVVPAAESSHASQASDLQPDTLLAALRAKLPAQLVPSRLIVLPRLPLRPNGKVDKARLPLLWEQFEASQQKTASEQQTTAVQQTTSIQPPANADEARLLAIWQDLLRAPEAGVTQDFFALGGDSLRLIRLLARIAAEWGMQLPAATIFAAPTVRQLAAVIRAQKSAATLAVTANGQAVPLPQPVISGVVWLTPGQAALPLVWLDPGSQLAPLVQAFGPAQPFASVALTPNEMAELPPPQGMEQMAARLADKIQQQWPGGPTMLVSFCLRTILAVETARALQARGQAVPLLVLADPVDPNTIHHALHPAAPSTLAWRAKQHWLQFRQGPAPDLGRYVVHLGRAFGRRLHSQFGPNLVRDLPVFAAGARHRLQPYCGPVLLVRFGPPESAAQSTAECLSNWRPFLTGPLQVRHISGAHMDIFAAPKAGEFAAIVREALQAQQPS